MNDGCSSFLLPGFTLGCVSVIVITMVVINILVAAAPQETIEGSMEPQVGEQTLGGAEVAETQK